MRPTGTEHHDLTGHEHQTRVLQPHSHCPRWSEDDAAPTPQASVLEGYLGAGPECVLGPLNQGSAGVSAAETEFYHLHVSTF